MVLLDRRNRPLRDLRISVTDRCNFRCRYCMPREVFSKDFEFLPHAQILSFEEIQRLTRLFMLEGVEKLRVTGGEPLLRRDIHKLIALLVDLGPSDLALTTNGALLKEHALALKQAGLKRITVSLDSLDERVFRHVTDTHLSPRVVLDGIEAAHAAGLTVKVNAVIRRGVNDHTLLDLVRHFSSTPHILRLIEFMDVGASNGWRPSEVVSAQEMIERIGQELALEPLEPNYLGEVARRWRLLDTGAEIGVISSVTEPFCGSCTRARLAADGSVYTCLFATRGSDFREPLRDGSTDEQIRSRLRALWQGRDDRYSELRKPGRVYLPKVEMSYIGG